MLYSLILFTGIQYTIIFICDYEENFVYYTDMLMNKIIAVKMIVSFSK